MSSLTSLFIPLLFLSSALAHGLVATFTVDGKAFKGPLPGVSNPPDSVIRQIADAEPIKGATNPAVNCGKSAGPAALVADANPGSALTFDWRDSSGQGPWPHNVGPMLTYMTSCGSDSCADFDSTNAKWFKIQQVGRKSDGGEWAQQDLMAGGVAAVTLPQNIAPGNYLIRHEIIALHLGNTQGGAEFYEGCVQLRVGGSQSGAPTQDELVSLPGAYSDNDPGIFDPNVFDPSAPYVFPGPKVATFVGGSSSGSDTGSGTSSGSGSGSSGSGSASSSVSAGKPAATSPAIPASTGTGSSSTSNSNSSSSSTGGSCKLKKRTVADVRARHAVRYMRRLAFGKTH